MATLEEWGPSENGAPGAGEGAATILVVDDNEDCRTALRAFLEAWRYDVYEAADGEEAVDRARELTPDLILIDVMMPGVDGLEATRRIRSLPGLDEVRIVAISAMEGAEEASEAAGCDACVLKPLDMREFAGRVAGWLAES